MILELNEWHLGYDQIVKDTRGSDVCSVWVLCNADVDSLAAARILTYIFRADGIQYQIRPCWSYSSLTNLLKTEEAQELRSLVLLNLGASRNLTKLFQQEMLTTDAKIYVMDCRKPVHLANVHAGHNVVVFWDESQKKSELPSDGDNLSGNDSTTDEDDSSSDEEEEDNSSVDQYSDDGEAEFDDEGDIIGKSTENDDSSQTEQSRVEEDYDAGDEDNTDDEGLDNERKRNGEEGNSVSAKRQKQNDDDSQTTEEEDVAGVDVDKQLLSEQIQPMLTPGQLHQQRRNRLRGYYSGGTYYGSPVAWMAYKLAAQKRWKDNGDLLWLACVGLSDAHVHSRIDKAGYTHLSMDLKTSCQQVFPNEMVDRVDKTIYAESLVGGRNNNGNRTQVTLSDNGRILAETDYRFFLLRHQSLFNAMLHSNYVASKLQVWNHQGKQRLQELLAKMGFPLDECRQPYAFMNPHLKRKLRDKMSEYKNEYGLDNLEYTSFQRVTGYKSLMSASDVAYAVAALLESESPDSFHTALEALNTKAIPSVTGEESGGSLVNGGALVGGIGTGLLKAIQLQSKIVSTAMSIVERKAITRLRHFRYAFVACTSQENKDSLFAQESSEKKEYHIFAQPLALTRLAHWLMDMHRENGKWTGNKNRPLVLCAENPLTNTYLVVGYEFPDRQGLFLKNHFGQHFQMTCTSMQGSFRLDSFDSHVVEIGAKDVQRFIEQLHYLMDSV
eukprot:CAMPEP_0194222330 /NCGR_PEP_ID=MMETSP0156-20130528/32660_1 /TAXON_ID=33649 /ORGANISM="Thalassionema nitzschioides, Strain L26-B" /LENGTH=723 /DNA_ID=CAMNT_0038953075 /DNA_START=19 /DNA_END=2190 /DNA_ORIENTATION=+